LRNILIESCIELIEAGYEEREKVRLPYLNKRFLSLGNFLLSRAELGKKFHMKFTGIANRPRDQKSVALCFGGGIDSYLAFFRAVQKYEEVHLVHVDYGQKFADHERNVLRKLRNGGWEAGEKSLLSPTPFRDDIKKHVPEKTQLVFHEEGVRIAHISGKDLAFSQYIVPARNLLLAAVASQYSHRVWIASSRDDEEGDTTSHFFLECGKLFTEYTGHKVWVESPIANISKLDLVREYLQNGGSEDALRETFSCYAPLFSPGIKPSHCGECLACVERYLLFQDLNLEFSFAINPVDGKNWYKLLEKIKQPVQVA
jgi:7-cyano-7-deazaguanine synthase in queuosine biosynthesis